MREGDGEYVVRDLIYFFDGGGRWVIQLAVTLILVAVAIWLMAKKDSPMWDDDPWDDAPGWGEDKDKTGRT